MQFATQKTSCSLFYLRELSLHFQESIFNSGYGYGEDDDGTDYKLRLSALLKVKKVEVVKKLIPKILFSKFSIGTCDINKFILTENLKFNSSSVYLNQTYVTLNFASSNVHTSTLSGELNLNLKRFVLYEPVYGLSLEDHWNKTSYLLNFRKINSFCDFTFIVKNKKIQVHKLIMNEASDVLSTMFLGNFKESRSISTTISDVSSKVFETMIFYIYGDRANFEKNATTASLYDIFEVAHIYNIKRLQDYCIARIFVELTYVDQVMGTYMFACKYDIQDLKTYCWEVIQL